MEGFSIREYVLRMRSVKLVKTWPFDDFTAEQTVDSFLPPIMVKKFSWWLDEPETSRSAIAIDFGNSKGQKKRVEVKGETSLRGVEDVEESDMDVECLGVVKAPKKRSIVEIFAAAPFSVETAINHGEEKDNHDKELEGFSVNYKWGLKGKRNEKNKEKKNKETMLSKLKNTKKARENFKNKKRRGDKEMDMLVPNKEKRLKLKPRAQDNASTNLLPLYNKESEYGIRDHVSIHKRNSRLRGLDADKKTMASKAYKLMSENQHKILPVRGILKNNAKVISVQNSAKNILQEPIQFNYRGKQKENKHVSFSKKDYMIKLAKKSLFSVERPILNGSDMDAVAASFCEVDVQGIKKDSTLVEISGSEELSNGIVKEINIGHSCKDPSTFHIDTTNYLKQHKQDEFFGGSVTSEQNKLHGLKNYLFDSGLKELPQILVHAHPPGFCCIPLECCCRTQNINMMCDPSNSKCGSLVEDLWSSGAICHPLYFKYKMPSVPYLYNRGGINNMSQVSSQSKMENLFSHPYPYQTFPNLSSKENMHSLCASTYGNRRGYLCEKRSINGLTECFLALPLTLQGELIELNSSVDLDVSEIKSSITADIYPSLSTRSNIMSKCLSNYSDCRNWGCRTSVDQLNLGPFQDNRKAEPFVVPSNLEFPKCQSNEIGECGLGLIKMCPFQPNKSISNQNNQMQKFPGNEKIISLVRVMGKEFIVGGRLGGLRDTLTCP